MKLSYTLFTLLIGITLHSQSLELEGSLKIIDGTEGKDRILVSDEDGLGKWTSADSLFPAGSAIGEMLYWDGNKWNAIAPGTNGQSLTYCDNIPTWGPCEGGTVSNGTLNDTTLTITQSWSQETDTARQVIVDVPVMDGVYPVVIALHGNGGMPNTNSIAFLGNNVIRVAPDGYLTSWNVKRENSKAPDVAFISDLLTLLKTYDNVDADNITILGSSNGSALLNRLLIELPLGSFKNAVSIVSPKTTDMYNNGSFYYDPSGGNNYNSTIIPANDRRIFAVAGTNDGLIPYNGGLSPIGYTFMPAQESAFRWAQLKGYSGAQLADSDGVADPDNAKLFRYEYLSGDVVHYKLVDGGHGTGGDAQVQQRIKDFLGL